MDNSSAFPVWINIEERKPEKLRRVLVAFKNSYGKIFITIAEYVPPKEVLAEDFLSEDCDNFQEYDEEKDCYWTPSGFYEWTHEGDINYFLSEKINFWTELPQLPRAMLSAGKGEENE